MDEFNFDAFASFLNAFIINGRANGKTQAQQYAQDEARIKRETTREVTSDGRFVRTTTLSLIQEGEFEEIEDAETGEIAVRELADQTADRREEILSDEADENRVQGGSEKTVCGIRDREEEPDDSGRGD
jgi:hypothetical protein